VKILIHSFEASGLIMVRRLQEEGHEVYAFIKDKESKDAFDGIVDKVETIEQGIKLNPDFVFFDDVDDGEVADKIKKYGIPVVGAGDFNDKIELDREFGIETMKQAGIQYPDTFDFKSVDKAIKFIDANPDRYVVKTNEIMCYSSYVSKSPEDMKFMLDHFRNEKLMSEKDGFILQRFVEGYEISTEGWFNGTEFVSGAFNHCIEEKKFMTGGIGPTTGCEGSVVFQAGDGEPLVLNLVKMTDILRKHDYKGAIDLNTIVDKKGIPYALEFCGRVGYVCFENFIHLYDGALGEFLYEVATGADDIVCNLSNDLCIGIRLTTPPYPHDELPESVPEETKLKIGEYLGRRSRNMAIREWEDVEKNFYWLGVRMDENGLLRVATNDGVIGSICARGETIEECKKEAYAALNKISIPDKQYRIDIGDRAQEWFDLVEKKVEEKKKDVRMHDSSTWSRPLKEFRRRFSRSDY
jgi:phosphoribosylamine---glycine ligase